jgi:hypothetical protein
MNDQSKGIVTYYDEFSRLRKIRPAALLCIWAVFIGAFIALLLRSHGV